MAIIKNPYPILEYDTSSPEVLKPEYRATFPERCVYGFCGKAIWNYAKANDARMREIFVTIGGGHPVFVLGDKRDGICLCDAPLGAPAAAQIMEALITCGCKKIISTGSCSTLTDASENLFIIPTKALRDEGTSYKYLPPARSIEVDTRAVTAISQALEDSGFPYSECMTWTTDALIRETEDIVQLRLKEGCKVVEMECAALAACAKMRGAIFGQLLFTADPLADPKSRDRRGWGNASVNTALEICINAVNRL